MMEPVKEYTSNYFKTYFWKFIGYFASFGSLVVVTPHLSSSPALFGIFTFCLSLNIFFQYADLGFLNAAMKYASEFYGRNDLKGEISVTGFSCFILSVIFIPLCLGLLWLAYHPELAIKGISTSPEEMAIAFRLLIILFAFSPLLIIQRIVQLIFSVRVEGFQTQRINIAISVIRIISIFYFFGGGRYMLVDYFLFYNCLSLIAVAAMIYIARKRYNYNFLLLLKNIRFSKNYYTLTSKLAYNSFFLAVVWILFYELDLIYIGYFIGKMAVAYYALGFTILTFFRDAFGTFYTPFTIRLNHFIGQKNEHGLRNMYDALLKIGVPIVVIPVISLFLLVRPLILAWVGHQYQPSVIIGQILIIAALFGCITYPTNALLVAKERLRILYISTSILPVIFFAGVLSTQHILGIKSYAIFKVLALFINASFYFYITIRYLKLSGFNFFRIYISPVILPLIPVVISGLVINNLLNPVKGAAYLFEIGAFWLLLVIIGFTLYYFSNEYFRNTFNTTFYKLIRR